MLEDEDAERGVEQGRDVPCREGSVHRDRRSDRPAAVARAARDFVGVHRLRATFSGAELARLARQKDRAFDLKVFAFALDGLNRQSRSTSRWTKEHIGRCEKSSANGAGH